MTVPDPVAISPTLDKEELKEMRETSLGGGYRRNKGTGAAT